MKIVNLSDRFSKQIKKSVNAACKDDCGCIWCTVSKLKYIPCSLLLVVSLATSLKVPTARLIVDVPQEGIDIPVLPKCTKPGQKACTTMLTAFLERVATYRGSGRVEGTPLRFDRIS